MPLLHICYVPRCADKGKHQPRMQAKGSGAIKLGRRRESHQGPPCVTPYRPHMRSCLCVYILTHACDAVQVKRPSLTALCTQLPNSDAGGLSVAHKEGQTDSTVAAFYGFGELSGYAGCWVIV